MAKYATNVTTGNTAHHFVLELLDDDKEVHGHLLQAFSEEQQAYVFIDINEVVRVYPVAAVTAITIKKIQEGASEDGRPGRAQ